MLTWKPFCTWKEVLRKMTWKNDYGSLFFHFTLKFNLTHPDSTAKFPSLASSTLHPGHWKVYITHCNCTWKCIIKCIFTLHTTHWTLCITRHTFILHAANLSLHTETSNICLNDTQDLHGKMNLNLLFRHGTAPVGGPKHPDTHRNL